jgi:hypothetical protein
MFRENSSHFSAFQSQFRRAVKGRLDRAAG